MLCWDIKPHKDLLMYVHIGTRIISNWNIAGSGNLLELESMEIPPSGSSGSLCQQMFPLRSDGHLKKENKYGIHFREGPTSINLPVELN